MPQKLEQIETRKTFPFSLLLIPTAGGPRRRRRTPHQLLLRTDSRRTSPSRTPQIDFLANPRRFSLSCTPRFSISSVAIESPLRNCDQQIQFSRVVKRQDNRIHDISTSLRLQSNALRSASPSSTASNALLAEPTDLRSTHIHTARASSRAISSGLLPTDLLQTSPTTAISPPPSAVPTATAYPTLGPAKPTPTAGYCMIPLWD